MPRAPTCSSSFLVVPPQGQDQGTWKQRGQGEWWGQWTRTAFPAGHSPQHTHHGLLYSPGHRLGPRTRLIPRSQCKGRSRGIKECVTACVCVPAASGEHGPPVRRGLGRTPCAPRCDPKVPPQTAGLAPRGLGQGVANVFCEGPDSALWALGVTACLSQRHSWADLARKQPWPTRKRAGAAACQQYYSRNQGVGPLGLTGPSFPSLVPAPGPRTEAPPAHLRVPWKTASVSTPPLQGGPDPACPGHRLSPQ